MGNFLKEFFERNFWEDFLGGFFWEEFFGRNYLVEINKELMFLSRFWGNARRRRKDKKFRSLEVRGKPIALKNRYIMCNIYDNCLPVLNLTHFLIEYPASSLHSVGFPGSFHFLFVPNVE